MSAPTYDAAGEADARTGTDAPERRVISEKAIAEMEALHRDVLATKPSKPWTPRSSRRRYREARVAESDFLRALGFADWEQFDALVRSGRPVVPQPQPHAGPAAELPGAEMFVDLVAAEPAERIGEAPLDLVVIADLLRLVLHQLADTRVDLEVLQASSARADEVLDRALTEIVALRLELIVAARRASS
jgi:hypothetical protein